MTYSPTIYDWRYTVQPVQQLFRAGGVALDGGMTVGGIGVESPEPWGRAELLMEFDRIASAAANLDVSWLASRMMNGAVFRIRLFYPTVQLVSDSALGGSTELGVNWSNSLPFSDSMAWAFDPQAGIVGTAAKGAASFVVNMAPLGRVLKVGHVIGFHIDGYDFAHVVTDISYSATDRATVEIQPPLRRALAATDVMKLRPIATVTCTNAREVVANLLYGTTATVNPARFVEALV
jgi:hypothetical protein